MVELRHWLYAAVNTLSQSLRAIWMREAQTPTMLYYLLSLRNRVTHCLRQIRILATCLPSRSGSPPEVLTLSAYHHHPSSHDSLLASL